MIITPVFIGVLTLLQVPLTVAVGLRRVRTGIHFFDGGDLRLLRLMRAHGNYTETVPIVLVALGAAESLGAQAPLLVAAGCSLVCGRVLHYATVVLTGFGIGRALGMILTFLPMLVLGGFLLSRAPW